MLANLWQKWMTPKRRPIVQRRTPGLELLEDRSVPTATIAEFPVAAGSTPYGITTGPDGNIWFTQNQSSRIAVLNPVTRGITEYATPTANSGPTGITAGPDGNIWFLQANINKIGVINPTTHVISEYAIPTAGSQPVGITAGPDGNIWFTEMATNKIGMINVTTFAVREFNIPTANSAPMQIAAGQDGNLWFTERNGNKVATISPISYAIKEYAIPSANSQPVGITAGPDGNMWFTEYNTNRVVKMNATTHSGIVEYAIPTRKSGPVGITTGPDGNIWFTENAGNRIGSINPTTGVISEIAVPSAGAAPVLITAGPGGTLWFTETTTNRIGQVLVAPTIATPPSNATVTEGQTATFQASAAGLPTPTVQWQVSTNGGTTYTPLSNGGAYSGVTTGTLTITSATTAMSGYLYRAVFSNGVGTSAATAPATLSVNTVLNLVPALAQGVINTPYSQTVSLVGSPAPLTTFTVTNFNPGTTGLTFANVAVNAANGAITISGMPSGVGTATFTVTAANTAGNTLTQTLTITIRPPLGIDTPALLPATAGVPYSQTVNVVGGAMPYTTFAVTNFSGGDTGLTAANIAALASAGTFTISGTPTAGGTVRFTISVSDSVGAAITKDYTLTVNPALVITPSLPAGTAGTKYQQVLTVTGGGVPYGTIEVVGFDAGTTGLTSSNLVANVGAGTVTINGTPTAAGTITFTVNVVDALAATLTKVYSVAINPGLTITPSLPQGTTGAAYQQTLTVTGGSAPYTTFTITGFTAGSTGLTAAAIVSNAAGGTITISGMPTGAGTLAFTVKVVDSAGGSLTKSYSVAVNPALAISNLSASQWTAGLAGFTGTMNITGGTVPHALVGATGIPTGLAPVLTGNKISLVGTPTVPGTFAGSVTVQDAAGASVTRSFTITINAPPVVGALTASQWTIGRTGFTGVLQTAGGTGSLSLVSSAGLPTGLTVSLSNGTLRFAGTPSATGSFVGTVTLRDGLGATVTRSFAITINSPPSVGNLTASQWTAGLAGFTGTLAVNAGTGPFTLKNATGLPAGMNAIVVGNTIRFTGTPTTAKTFSASITIVDAAGASTVKTFTITINPPVSFTTTGFPPSRMASVYNSSVQAKGGTGAISYVLSAGSLPPGMTLSSKGTISGVSRGFGTFTFTITAIDAVGAMVSQQYTLKLTMR